MLSWPLSLRSKEEQMLSPRKSTSLLFLGVMAVAACGNDDGIAAPTDGASGSGGSSQTGGTGGGSGTGGNAGSTTGGSAGQSTGGAGGGGGGQSGAGQGGAGRGGSSGGGSGGQAGSATAGTAGQGGTAGGGGASGSGGQSGSGGSAPDAGGAGGQGGSAGMDAGQNPEGGPGGNDVRIDNVTPPDASGCRPAGNITVVNNIMFSWLIDGASNPALKLCRGLTYTFSVNAPSHPFYLKTILSLGNVNAYNDGVTNNGATVGDVVFVVPQNAPATLYYVCSLHSSMSGTIQIVN